METLDGIGYHGWVAAEMIPPVPFYKYAPETLIENTSLAMDRLFAWHGLNYTRLYAVI